MEEKRVFFALEVDAPWQDKEPEGRYIQKHLRHITLIFIGNLDVKKIEELLSTIEVPKFVISPSGIFDKMLALPERSPNVIAYRIKWLSNHKLLDEYRSSLFSFLEKSDVAIKNTKGEFLPHVTLCRKPFIIKDWRKSFFKLPVYITKLHLYESLKNSNYESLWSHSFIAPFEEFEHTADLAFYIRGKTYFDLYVNGFIALCFKFTKLCEYYIEKDIENIDDVIIGLNDIVTKVDMDIGSPFKAVSFQASVEEKKDFYQWEMIIDV